MSLSRHNQRKEKKQKKLIHHYGISAKRCPKMYTYVCTLYKYDLKPTLGNTPHSETQYLPPGYPATPGHQPIRIRSDGEPQTERKNSTTEETPTRPVWVFFCVWKLNVWVNKSERTDRETTTTRTSTMSTVNVRVPLSIRLAEARVLTMRLGL